MSAVLRFGPLALAVMWAAASLLVPTSRYQGPGASYPGVVLDFAGEALGGQRLRPGALVGSFGFGGGSTASDLGMRVICGGGLAVSVWLLLAADQGS